MGSNASVQVPEAWILCDGKQTCKNGVFKNEVCQDLAGRALIGADIKQNTLALQNAQLPDHKHRHRHSGTKAYKFEYWKAHTGYKKKFKTHKDSYSNIVYDANHYYSRETEVQVDYSDMQYSEALVSDVIGSNVTVSKSSGELYPPNLRVNFIFRCY